MKNDEKYRIKKMDIEQLPEVVELVRRVFDEFQAPEFSAQGVREFYERTIAPELMRARIGAGLLEIWCCMDGSKPVGMIGRRPPAHVALLFVDPKHHRKGIARALFEAAFDGSAHEVTVNSSLYAVRVYEKLGFEAIGGEETMNGIRAVPMKKKNT